MLPEMSIIRITSIGAGVELPVTLSWTSNWLHVVLCWITVLSNVIWPIAKFVVKTIKIEAIIIVKYNGNNFEFCMVSFIRQCFKF